MREIRSSRRDIVLTRRKRERAAFLLHRAAARALPCSRPGVPYGPAAITRPGSAASADFRKTVACVALMIARRSGIIGEEESGPIKLGVFHRTIAQTGIPPV